MDLEREPIVQRVSQPCEALERRARFLLHHVDGEFEDEDGDTANGFILADPIPSAFICSLFDSGNRVAAAATMTGLFDCSLCKREKPLENLALPILTCSCLFCKPCLESYASSLFGVSDDQAGTSSAKRYNRLNRQLNKLKFIDLTGSSSAVGEYIPCPLSACTGQFAVTELQTLVPKSFSEWEAAASEAFMESCSCFVKCPGCQVMIEKVKSELPPGLAPCGVPELDRTLPFTELDNDRRPMSRRAMVHKAVNRFRCVLCNLEFCGACLASPYHLGKTCEELKREANAVKCIYCTKPVEEEEVEVVAESVKQIQMELEREGVDTTWCVEKPDLIAVQNLNSRVCRDEVCRKHLRQACTRVLQCGHRCGGVRGELHCLPCLEDGCSSSSIHLPSTDDVCGVCLVDEIRAAPAIQLQCGHVFHLHCVKQQIRKGSPGPQITFGHLKCSQCKAVLKHSSLEACMRKPLQLMNQINAKALKRMEMEGISNDPESKEALLKSYQYYMCSKCNIPYYGGKRNCQPAEQRRQYNSAELVCGACVAGPDGKCKRGHGTEFIEFKCRFCCSPATFFCFGTTHFCNSCHTTRPDRSTSFPACRGPGHCLVGGRHSPNGTEFCLGCSMCRSQQQQ